MRGLGMIGAAALLAAGCTGRDSASASAGSSSAASSGTSSQGSTADADGSTGATTQTPQTSGSEDATSTGALGGTTCGFFCEDDTDGSPSTACSVYAQDCPAGERCSPTDGWNTTHCVPVADDPAEPGEPCTIEGDRYDGIDTCDVGALCWDVDEGTGLGTCFAHCVGGSESAATCMDPARRCWIGAAGFPAICMPSCDALDATTCGEGQGCYPTDGGFGCAPVGSDPPLEAFDACEYTNHCGSGLACIQSPLVGACSEGSARCCTPLCSLSDADCPASTVCAVHPNGGGAAPGTKDVGYCLDPAD